MNLIRIFFIIVIIMVDRFCFAEPMVYKEYRSKNIGKVFKIEKSKFLSTCFIASIAIKEKKDVVIVMSFHSLKNVGNIKNIRIEFKIDKKTYEVKGSDIRKYRWYAEDDVVFLYPPSHIIDKFDDPLLIENKQINYYELFVTTGYSNAHWDHAFSTLRAQPKISRLYDFDDNNKQLYVVESDICPGSSGSPLLKRDILDNNVYGMVSFGLRTPQKEIYYITPQNLIKAYEHGNIEFLEQENTTIKQNSRLLKKAMDQFGQNFAAKWNNVSYYNLTEPFRDRYSFSISFNSKPFSQQDNEDLHFPDINISAGKLTYFNNNCFWGYFLLLRHRKSSVNIINGEINTVALGGSFELGINNKNINKWSFLLSAGHNFYKYQYTTRKTEIGNNSSSFFIVGLKGSFFIEETSMFTFDFGLNHEWTFFKPRTKSSCSIFCGFSFDPNKVFIKNSYQRLKDLF